MQTITLIVNSAPYGSEGPYNTFRLASALLAERAAVRLFLMADAILAAKTGQKAPEGYYNTQTMLTDLIAKGALVRLCGTCAKARGITEGEIVEGAAISSMIELAKWVLDSDRVISF